MRNYTSWILLSLLIITVCKTGQTQPLNIVLSNQWFDTQSINCTVLLEKAQGDSFIPHGTGFLFYNYKKQGRPIVITCAHLLRRPEIFVVVTADSELISYAKTFGKRHIEVEMAGSTWMLEENLLRTRIELQENYTYATHPNSSLDIAAFPIGLGTTSTIDGIRYKFTKTTTIPQSMVRQRTEANLTDEIYFVGFPFGIGTKDILCPLIRTGSIAWFSHSSNEFLIDAFSYSGNSGSPVFIKINQEGKGPYIIGMVTGHLGIDVENFGLARCVWIDDILTIIKLAENLD